MDSHQDGDLTISEAFQILSLPTTADNASIRKSYRQLSLRLHPDKAKDVSAEVAATRFDRLQKAYELVNDPKVRNDLLAKQKEESIRKEKVERFEAQRKKMSQDLVERERMQEETRREEKRKDRERWERVQMLKEQGRKLKEMALQAKEQELQSAIKNQSSRQERPPTEPSLGDMDTSIRLLYPSSLTTVSIPHLKSTLESQFGTILHLDNRSDHPAADSGSKRKRTEETTLVITFESIDSAFKCVESGGNFQLSRLGQEWDEIWIEWYSTRSELRSRRKKSKSGNEDISGYEKEEKELKECKVGEPLRVRYWRRYQPDKIQKLLGSDKSATSFEEDVLQRAMAAGQTNNNGNNQKQCSDPSASSTSLEADVLVLQRAMAAGNTNGNKQTQSSDTSFEADVLSRAMAAGQSNPQQQSSDPSFEADVLQRAMAAGQSNPQQQSSDPSFEADVLQRAMAAGQSNPQQQSSDPSFEADVLQRAMAAGSSNTQQQSSDTSFDADVLSRAMAAGQNQC
ncbi:unnamed protein product [Sympodiomycopsis kandeliae]